LPFYYRTPLGRQGHGQARPNRGQTWRLMSSIAATLTPHQVDTLATLIGRHAIVETVLLLSNEIGRFGGVPPRTSSLTDLGYLPRTHLAFAMSRAVSHFLRTRSNLKIIDIGSGEKPYHWLFTPYAHEYIGVDVVPCSRTDIRAAAEHLPIRSACLDVIVCTQVLEHLTDPPRALSEWFRILRPGGIVFASTHGTFWYHPDPVDYWRWTHTGLRRLFETVWFRVHTVEACEGVPSVAALLLGHLAARAAHRLRVWPLLRPILAALHAAAIAADPPNRTRVPSDMAAGTIAINYLVVAKKPFIQTL
jgi:SAM-dependent methyltransferase